MALFACGIFCFHPSAILYVNNVGQECFFQVFLIYSLFFLIRFLEFNDSIKNLMLSAFFFALCFLTKSYILLWSPCIALILFFRIKSTKKAIQYTLIYMILCVLMTMPYGFYNLKKHGIYTLSSNGIEFFFWFGNSESTYLSDYCIESYEKRFSEKLPTDTAFFIHSHSLPLSNMTIEKYADILKQMPPVKERQRYFKEGAKKWISENRDKWLNLKMFYLKRYILPGLNRHFFVFNRWLFMLIISVPFYFLAYWGIIEAIRKDLKKHFWILSLWVILLLFCVFFHSENRFRSITIEPYFAIYAPIGFQKMIQSLNKIRQFIKL